MNRSAPPPHSRGTEFDVGKFVRAAAHEIAGQINAISMNAELVKLLLERSDVARADETIKRMLSDCGRYGRMVRGLERFGACMTARERETVKVADLIDGATAAFIQERSSAKPTMTADIGRTYETAARPTATRSASWAKNSPADPGSAAARAIASTGVPPLMPWS